MPISYKSYLFSGEPYAGDPHKRFGERRTGNGALPYPYLFMAGCESLLAQGLNSKASVLH